MSLKSELLKFLLRIPNTSTASERKALLDFVDFGHLNDNLAQAENKLVFFSELLELLRSEGQESLGRFLRELADPQLVGYDDRNKLIKFANDICALKSDGWNREFYGVPDDDGQGVNEISMSELDLPERDECPYKGLFAFQQEDAKFFFGRDRFTTASIELVKSQPLLAVIGNSGMGKSSVVFAGLIPELEKVGGWQFLTFRPKANPFLELTQGLVGFLNPALTKDEPQFIDERTEYVESLTNQQLRLKDILDDALAENYPCQRLLIVVDQFEELYTLCSPDDRNLFIDHLLQVIDAEKDKENPDVVIAFTLRVDFYGFVLDYQPLAEVLQQWKPETLIGMSREELQSAIEKPAEVVGLKIQDGLTKIILDEVTNNPGELPLLEFALEELWKQRSDRQLTIAAYHQIGGIEQALANHAESVYKKFKRTQPQIKHIFTQLVRFGEQTENTRRLATYEQIGASNWKLVSRLADNRLVVTGQNTDISQRTVEVVHEALIRGWERLQQWMTEDRDFRKWQDRLRFAIKTWEETGRANSALLRGALLVEAEDWLQERREDITDAKEIEFIKASRQLQEQEELEHIQELLTSSQLEWELKQYLLSLFKTVKAGLKLRKVTSASKWLKDSIIERLDQSIYEISEQNKLSSHTAAVVGVAFSPDGSMIASASDDGTVKLWSLNGQLLNTFEGHTNEVYGVSFSPDGQIIASGSYDRTVRLWKIDGTPWKTLQGHRDRVWGVSFSPDGQLLASGSFDNTVKLWSVDGKCLRTLEGHTDDVYGVSFSPDGQLVASAGDKTVRIWKTDGTPWKTLSGHTEGVWAVSFSPDGQLLASVSDDRTVKLWKVDGSLWKTLHGHNYAVWGVSFSPDGQLLASASLDNTVRIWKVDGTPWKTLYGHSDGVRGISFSPNSQLVASASYDRTVRIWKTDSKIFKTLSGHSDRVYALSVNNKEQLIASASIDQSIKLWKTDGTPWKTLHGHSDVIWGLSFSPDGQLLASASFDLTVRLWKTDGTPWKTLSGHANGVSAVSFSPDGKLLASASNDRTVKLWKIDGTLWKTLHGHSDVLWGLSFSPDGQVLASASNDQTVKLWKIDGTLWKTLSGHNHAVYAVSFSPDGQIIASASHDKTVKLWKIDGTFLKTLYGHGDGVCGICFSSDSQLIASAGLDRKLKIWKTDGTLLRTLNGNDGFRTVSFSCDDQWLAASCYDNTVKLWFIDYEELTLDLDSKLDNFVQKGCHWIRDYVKTNPDVSENDRNLCDDYC